MTTDTEDFLVLFFYVLINYQEEKQNDFLYPIQEGKRLNANCTLIRSLNLQIECTSAGLFREADSSSSLQSLH